MQQQHNVLVTPFFKVIAEQNVNESRKAGRPIFDDVEYVEVRIAGERNYAPSFQALSMWQRENGVEVTYAERWPDQYRAFKEGRAQVASGTPLQELPFLTESKRAELRALKIYTAEALAGLEGKNLKSLGMEGNQLKMQAKTYLENATGSASVIRMSEEIVALRAQIEELKAAGMRPMQPVGNTFVEPAPPMPTSPLLASLDDEQLKELIAEKTGSRPRGNPNHETLVRMAEDVTSDVAA